MVGSKTKSAGSTRHNPWIEGCRGERFVRPRARIALLAFLSGLLGLIASFDLVSAQASFDLSVTPSSQTVSVESVTGVFYDISVQVPSGQPDYMVWLEVSDIPPGAYYGLGPIIGSIPPYHSTLQITPMASTPPGRYLITVKAETKPYESVGQVTRYKTVTLIVEKPSQGATVGEPSQGTTYYPEFGPFTPGAEVTPWKPELNTIEQLRKQAALIGHYRGDEYGGYIGGCAGTDEKVQMRDLLEEAIQTGEHIRDYYGQAEQGNYIIEAASKELDYAMSLPPCPDSGEGTGETPEETTLTWEDADGGGWAASAGGLSLFVVEPVAAVAVAAAVVQYFLAVRIARKLRIGKVRVGKRQPRRGPTVQSPVQVPRSVSSPPGPRYSPAPSPPTSPETPPSPIAGGGQPIGGQGITTFRKPYPPVQDLQIGGYGGTVTLDWKKPDFDPASAELVGYEIYRQEPAPGSTGWERVLIDVVVPEAIHFDVLHKEPSRFYGVDPIYRTLPEGRIIVGHVPM